MAPREPRRIEVAKLSSETKAGDETDSLLCLLCYYYPQYTFRQAKSLPIRRVNALLKVARQQEAVKYKNLTQIMAAPHSKKGQAVSKLLKHYDGIIKKG